MCIRDSNVVWAEAYLHIKWHLSNHLVTIHQRYRQTHRTDNSPVAHGEPLLVTVVQKTLEMSYITKQSNVLHCIYFCSVFINSDLTMPVFLAFIFLSKRLMQTEHSAKVQL